MKYGFNSACGYAEQTSAQNGNNENNNEQTQQGAQVENNSEETAQENPGFVKAHKKSIIATVAALIAVIGTYFTVKYIMKKYKKSKAEAEAIVAEAEAAQEQEKKDKK